MKIKNYLLVPKNLILVISTLIALLVQVIILFVPPQLGIANSGDFGRTMDLFNFYYIPGYFNFKHFFDVFTIGRPLGAPSYGGYMTANSFVIYVSMLINYIFQLINNNSQVYYIYSLSIIYVLLYCLGFYWLLQSLLIKVAPNIIKYIIISLAAILILTDTLFIQYFNSFFQEASFIVFFLLFCGAFLNFKSFGLDITLLSLVIFSKEQNLIFVLLYIPLFLKHKLNLSRAFIVIFFLSCIMFVYSNVNTYSKTLNLVDRFFFGLLHNKDVNSSKPILAKINIDINAGIFSNKTYFSIVPQINSSKDPSQAQLFQNVLATLTNSDVINGYLSFPSIFFINYKDYLEEMETTGPFPPNLGNYKVDQGEDAYRAVFMTGFSKYVLSHIVYIILINLFMMMILISRDKFNLSRWENGLIMLLNLICILSVAENFLGDGFSEVVKHATGIYYCESILLLLYISILLYKTPKVTS